MTEENGLHPMALLAGLGGLLVLMLIVTASAYQKTRLHVLARQMLRSKTHLKSDENSGSLPTFAKTAAETGNIRILKRWIQSTNNDINGKSVENMTALHYAARGGHGECVRLLLEHRADPNVFDERRITPLHLAAIGGHGVCVKVLLDAHADPLYQDMDCRTPMELAQESGNVGCARLLQRAMKKQTGTHDEKLTYRTERTSSVNNV